MGALKNISYQRMMLYAILTVLFACGETNFAGRNSVENSSDVEKRVLGGPDPNPIPDTGIVEGPEGIEPGGPTEGQPPQPINKVKDKENKAGNFALAWDWHCQGGFPLDQHHSKGLSNGGTHALKLEEGYENIQLSLAGKLCEPKEKSRDVVLVVDVSDSMSWEDPYNASSDSCGRLEAVSQVIASLEGSSTVRVGLVTFASWVVASSDGFLSVQEFKDQLLNSRLLCEATGTTNYADALNEARSLFLGHSLQGANREVLFLTDGVPSSMIASRIAAEEVRKENVFIATVMLGDEDDSHLIEDVASKDVKGDSIHVVAKNAKSLVAKFAKLAESNIESGVFKYKSIDEDDWVELNLMDYLNDGLFALPMIKLSLEEFEEGMEVYYEYQDSFGLTIKHEGKLIWDEDD